MSVLPESAGLANDRDAARGRRRGLGFGFWAMMAFAAACMIAAAIVATVYGVFGGRGAAPPTAPPAQSAPTAAPLTPLVQPIQPPPAAMSAASPPSEQLAGLESRVRRLEDGEARGLDAAAAALAAASLSEAAAGPRPFGNELAAVERLTPNSPHVQALVPLAQVGAPTRADLAAELVDIAARVSIAAHTPAKDAGFISQLGYAFSRVVSIRRVDAVGSGPDAVLARAQRRAAARRRQGAEARTATWRVR
jgi:hypothetical protein